MSALLRPWLYTHLLGKIALAVAEHFHHCETGLTVAELEGALVVECTETGRTLQVMKGAGYDDLGNFSALMSDRDFFIPAKISKKRVQKWEFDHADSFLRNGGGTMFQILAAELIMESSSDSTDDQRGFLNILEFKVLGCHGESRFGRPRSICEEDRWIDLLESYAGWAENRKLPLAESQTWTAHARNIVESSENCYTNDEFVKELLQSLLDDIHAASLTKSSNIDQERNTAQRLDGKTFSTELDVSAALNSRDHVTKGRTEIARDTESDIAIAHASPSSSIQVVVPTSRGEVDHKKPRVLKDVANTHGSLLTQKYSRRDARISKAQAKNLKPADGPWIPPQPGRQTPLANIPYGILEEVIKMRTKDTPKHFVGHNAALGKPRDLQEETQKTIYVDSQDWPPSSPIPDVSTKKRSLPPDSDDERYSQRQETTDLVEPSHEASSTFDDAKENLSPRATLTQNWRSEDPVDEEMLKERRSILNVQIPQHQVYGDVTVQALKDPLSPAPSTQRAESASPTVQPVPTPAPLPCADGELHSVKVQVPVTIVQPSRKHQSTDGHSSDPARAIKKQKSEFMAEQRAKRSEEGKGGEDGKSTKVISQSPTEAATPPNTIALTPTSTQIVRATQVRSQSSPIPKVASPAPSVESSSQSLPGDITRLSRSKRKRESAKSREPLDFEAFQACLTRPFVQEAETPKKWSKHVKANEVATEAQIIANTPVPANASRLSRDTTQPGKPNVVLPLQPASEPVQSKSETLCNQLASLKDKDAFQVFSRTYPTYRGVEKHFYRMCWLLQNIASKWRPPTYAFDHFVLCHKAEYIPYQLEAAENGDDPMPYEEWYVQRAGPPHGALERVINIAEVQEGAGIYETKFMSDKQKGAETALEVKQEHKKKKPKKQKRESLFAEELKALRKSS